MEKIVHDSPQEQRITDDGFRETVVQAGTIEDREAMRRLGKEQVFKRNFSFISIFGFAVMLMATWEAVLGTVAFGLGNGGPAGLIYTYIGVFIGFAFVSASMAEMASMAPTSGGQYHWVSEFAPRKYQKQVSYLIGWLGLLGYQVGVTVGAFFSGTIIQGLVVLNYPTYDYKRWHGTLIAMLITFLVALFNVFFARFLPLLGTLILFLHFGGWLAILVPLWVLAPRTPSDQVWNSFVDAGWGNIGLACLVGMITNVGSFIGGDAPAHLAEECKDASRTLPRAMLLTIIVNGAMGLVMLITFCYTVGDVEAAITSPTGYPIIEVFFQATGSAASATGMTVILIVLNIVNNLTNMAGASRQMFAFARDRGMPCHAWISRVRPGYYVPINAIIVSAFCACILHCINIGSSIAFNIIMSAGSIALITSYFTSIACITWRRLRGLPLLDTKFSMGKAALPVNLLSLAFLVLAYVFAFFPPIPDPSASAMNWAIVVYTGVLGLAVVYYVVRARHYYDGPVEYVRKTA